MKKGILSLAFIFIILNSFGQNGKINFKENYIVNWKNISDTNYTIYYLQFNFDPFPMTGTMNINFLDSLKAGKGWTLNKQEKKDLQNIITKKSSFGKGECGTFYTNAAFVIVKDKTIEGYIDIGCSYGQWNFNPENKIAGMILSNRGFNLMTTLLDKINIRKKK